MPELQLAKFTRADRASDNVIEVKYNPAELTFNKGVQIGEVAIPGLDSPILQFVRGQAETLTLELFFDSTDDGMGAQVKPVTTWTDKFYEFVKIDRSTHAPPVLCFEWGGSGFPGSNFIGPGSSQNRKEFQCVVESIRQTFTLFSPEGIPLRAKVNITLREYKTLHQQIQQIGFESADRTHARVVQQGETLSDIAGQVYGQPQRWREIADDNRIDNPFDLTPGTILHIRPLR